jgi:hypothetical protein
MGVVEEGAELRAANARGGIGHRLQQRLYVERRRKGDGGALQRFEGASLFALRGFTVFALGDVLDHAYHAEHGAYPSGATVNGNRAAIMLQLTQYTDQAGSYQSTRSATHRFGPYLRTIPPLPAGSRRGRDRIHTSDTGGAGWLYEVNGTPDTKCLDVHTYRDLLDKTIDRILAQQKGEEIK